MAIRRGILLLTVASAMLAFPQGAAPAGKPAILPARLLRCTLGRVANFDPAGRQSYADLRFEGAHRFELALPAIPVRTGPPPEAPLPPEPVDPRTRILADPDNLARGAPPHFDRVVDYWPERVELTTVINDPLVNLIIITPIDPVRRTARLMMTQATDISSLDLNHLYQGDCTVAYPAGRV